jgi:hypothetical protein
MYSFQSVFEILTCYSMNCFAVSEFSNWCKHFLNNSTAFSGNCDASQIAQS